MDPFREFTRAGLLKNVQYTQDLGITPNGTEPSPPSFSYSPGTPVGYLGVFISPSVLQTLVCFFLFLSHNYMSLESESLVPHLLDINFSHKSFKTDISTLPRCPDFRFWARIEHTHVSYKQNYILLSEKNQV